jgi:hypothetical protein
MVATVATVAMVAVVAVVAWPLLSSSPLVSPRLPSSPLSCPLLPSSPLFSSRLFSPLLASSPCCIVCALQASGLRADAAHVKEADDPAALTFPEAAGPPRAVVDEVTPRHVVISSDLIRSHPISSNLISSDLISSQVTPRHVVIDQSSPTSAHAHHPPLPLLPLHPATLDGPASAVENSIITRVDQVGDLLTCSLC